MTVTPRKMFFYTILAYYYVGIESKYNYGEVDPTVEAHLNREARKAECCAKKMRCCKRVATAPDNVEIRAVIVRCIGQPYGSNHMRNLNKKTLNRAALNNIQQFQGFDEDEPLVQSEVTKCEKKLILTIKLKNHGETNTRTQYIVVDHVYDPISDQTVRLLNPYVIKMKQEHISQTYRLKFMDFVNSQAREQVYNKHDGNYTGCCTEGNKPTCGIVKFQGKPIPYSTGFCCSCDAQKNALRQPQLESTPVVAYSDPAYLLDAVPCPRSQLSEKKGDLRQKTLEFIAAQKKKEKDKDNSKRDNNDDIYYVNPQPKHKKKIKNWRNSNNRKDQFNKFDSKVKDINNHFQIENNFKDLNNHFQVENNYKVQTMNDEYEDHLTSSKNSLDELNKENSDLKLQSKSSYTFRNKIPISPIHKEKNSYGSEKENAHSYSIEKENTLTKLDNKESTKREKTKPSMHKLLNSKTAYSPTNLDSFKTSIKNIADKAFNDAIKSQNAEEFNKNNLQQDKGPTPEDQEFDLPENIYEKRQVQSSGVQRRGGQNCADRYTPPRLNPDTYHESSHCLRFSRVWYSVYKLEKPVVEQEILFQLFEKYEFPGGGLRWRDLTNGKKIKLGTFWPYYKDEIPTIAMTFSAIFDDQDFCLNWRRVRLLIPEGIKLSDMHKYPEVVGGPPEYLLIPNERIVLSGDQCDVAGVGFEAFFKQRNRCSMPRGTCLHHQPYHLWYHDKQRERDGQQGCYFLKNHGKLSKNPIRRNATSDEKFLTLNYYGHYISLIDMEINADFNSVLRPTSTAIITEVYVDSTCPRRTFITIKVTNGGLLSSKFMVRICDCPLDLKGTLDVIRSDVVLIPPQNQHIFKLSVHTILTIDIFHCSVEVLNGEGELVALRRIKIQKQDRCICTWHCLCACIGSSSGLKCIPMKIDHYHATGFKGGLPIVTYAEHFTFFNDLLHVVLFIVSFILFTLLIMGLTKALIGLCCLPIGMWGLDILLDLPKPMNRYYDKAISDKEVLYDEGGWPIHPTTSEKVRNIPATAEFSINILFFFTYPTVMFILLLKRLCCPFQLPNKNWFKRRTCNDERCDYHKYQPHSDTVDTESNKSGEGKKTEPEVKEQTPSNPEVPPDKAPEAKGPPAETGDNKKKPTIKVSIKEHPKDKPSAKSSKTAPPTATDNENAPYYYSSTDDTTMSTNTTASTKDSKSSAKASSKPSKPSTKRGRD